MQGRGIVIEQVATDTARVMVDFTQMKSFGQDPLILDRGEGIRVTDVFGKTYIEVYPVFSRSISDTAYRS